VWQLMLVDPVVLVEAIVELGSVNTLATLQV